MDTRLEGRMTVKVMMIHERLPKTIVPTSEMFSVNQLELEKFLACCIVPVKVRHKNFDKELMTFAMLNTCSQGTFITTSLMEQLNISGIQTFINIKTLIGHQKESYIHS